MRTDDAAPLHPKFFRAGLSAYGWWHAALSYCNRYLTDGFIPSRDIDLVFPGTLHDDVLRVIEKLVREDALAVVENGYEMHDYLHYQPSRKAVLRLRKERKDAARHGGVISGKKRQALASTKHLALASTKREANGELPSLPDPTRPDPTVPDHATQNGSVPSPGPKAWKLSPTLQEALLATRFAGLAADQRWWQAELALHAERGVDFRGEIKKAEGWCASNPQRAPKKNLRRFLHGWFERADGDLR